MWILSVFRAITSRSRVQWVAAVLIAAGAGAVALYVTRPLPSTSTPAPFSGPDSLSSSEIQAILPEDAIRAIDDPRFVAANKAGMRDNLQIIGVEVGGEAHAYPIALLSRVEIVNDRLGGKNIAVTW